MEHHWAQSQEEQQYEQVCNIFLLLSSYIFLFQLCASFLWQYYCNAQPMENVSQQANIVMGFLTVMMAMMKNTIVLGVKILVCTSVHQMEYVLVNLHYVMK